MTTTESGLTVASDQAKLEPGGVFDVRFERTMNLAQRLHLMMTRLDYIQKTKPKPAADATKTLKYSIVTHDVVTAEVRKEAVACGVIMTPIDVELKIAGNMSIVTMKVQFTNIDDPEDVLVVATCGNGIDPGDKGPGKAMSYAFKYALLKGLMLETGDDPDLDQDVTRATDAEIQLGDMLRQLERETDQDIVKQTFEGPSLRPLVEQVSAEGGPNTALLRGRSAALARSVGLNLREIWK